MKPEEVITDSPDISKSYFSGRGHGEFDYGKRMKIIKSYEIIIQTKT